MSRIRERFAWYPVRVYETFEEWHGCIVFKRWGWWEQLKAVNNYNHGWIHFEREQTHDREK